METIMSREPSTMMTMAYSGNGPANQTRAYISVEGNLGIYKLQINVMHYAFVGMGHESSSIKSAAACWQCMMRKYIF